MMVVFVVIFLLLGCFVFIFCFVCFLGLFGVFFGFFTVRDIFVGQINILNHGAIHN